MKYTFEIMKEYEDSFRGISVYSVSEDKKLMVDFVALEELEDAQKEIDEAYQRGINDGSLDVKQRVEGAYQRGLEDGKAQDSHGCEGCEWDGTPFDVCSKCRNSYGNLYKRKESDDEIKVGDVVDWDGDLFIVTYIAFDGLCGVAEDGATYDAVLPENVKKTGRHFDIGDMLKGINWT